MTDPVDEGLLPPLEPPFEEEVWEADIARALRSLPPVEPPAGYFDQVGDELANRRLPSGGTRRWLTVAAALLVLATFVGTTRVLADRSGKLEINELVARHDDLVDETSLSVGSSTSSELARELVERASRTGRIPAGWHQEGFQRNEMVISVFESTDAAPMTANMVAAAYGSGRRLTDDLRSWRLSDTGLAGSAEGTDSLMASDGAGKGPVSLVVADSDGLTVVVGLPDDALDAMEARLAETADVGEAATATRLALEADGFTAVGS